MCDLPSWFFALPDWVRAFMFSDFCGGNPDLASWLTRLFAHIGFAAIISLSARWLAVTFGFLPFRWTTFAFFAAWIGKEVFLDMPTGNRSLVVMADSLVDLAAGWIGWKLPYRPEPTSDPSPQKRYAKVMPVLKRRR